MVAVKKVELVADGLAAHRPRFLDLLPRLQRSADRVAKWMPVLDAETVDVGFISGAQARPPRTAI